MIFMFWLTILANHLTLFLYIWWSLVMFPAQWRHLIKGTDLDHSTGEQHKMKLRQGLFKFNCLSWIDIINRFLSVWLARNDWGEEWFNLTIYSLYLQSLSERPFASLGSEEANILTPMDEEVKGSWADAAEQSDQQDDQWVNYLTFTRMLKWLT